MTTELFEFEILKASRIRLLQVMETVDNTILFKIPETFNNNIVWQIGHCITSQQRHMYMRSGLPMIYRRNLWKHSKLERHHIRGRIHQTLMK
ncbi:DinB family protein [Sphingobacterium multivorum]|uniref:DinB family protein n=1 Tax=Sphingobacterium multivorum TaxID=28454 RepID=UPI0031BB522A